MNNVTLATVVGMCVGIVWGTLTPRVQAEATRPPKVEARLVIDDVGRTIVEVLTADKLVEPQLQHYVGQWVPFHKPAEKEGRLLYRTQSYYTLSENVVLSLKSRSTEDGREFRTGLVVPRVPANTRGPVALRVGATEHVAQGQEPAATEAGHVDVGLAIINRYRAQRGLAPIQYDPGFADVSRINNEMGGGHRYNTGWQTWASPADPEAAVSMWMGSYYNSHGVIIMNPSITRGGTHSHPGSGTTFTGG